MNKIDNTYKVYKYTNLINGKVYIGRTKTSLAARARHEGKKYLKLKYFGNAIQKYGWDNFVSEILEDNLTFEECCKKEQEYIEIYDSRNSQKGYNIAKGGEGPTKEALQKMKQSHSKKHLSEEHKKHISQGLGLGVNNVNYGRKLSELARKHNSEAKSGENHPNWGKHLSEKTKEKIKKGNSNTCLQFSLSGEFIKEWESAKEAAKELGLNCTGINNCLRNVRHSSGGYKWEYKDKELREKYENNKFYLENYGVKYIPNKVNNQKKPSTTIPEMGVE